MRYIVFIGLLILALFSCRRVSEGEQGRLLARVGGERLYSSEVRALFTPGMAPSDSVRVLESYVDLWVRKQLKVAQAEKMFRDSNDDIERMVQEYRNSLLSHKIDQYRINLGVDTIYNDSAIATYYASHQADFPLDRWMVRGVVVRVPAAFRQKRQLAEKMRRSGEDYQDFLDISAKNGFELHEFTVWTSLSDFLASIPASVKRDAAERQVIAGVAAEVVEGSEAYLIYARERLKPGDPAPVEQVSDIIRRILINQGRQQAIRAYEDSLFRAAAAIKRAEIYL